MIWPHSKLVPTSKCVPTRLPCVFAEACVTLKNYFISSTCDRSLVVDGSSSIVGVSSPSLNAATSEHNKTPVKEAGWSAAEDPQDTGDSKPDAHNLPLVSRVESCACCLSVACYSGRKSYLPLFLFHHVIACPSCGSQMSMAVVHDQRENKVP